MLSRDPLPNPRSLYFSPIIGPLKAIYYNPNAKIEAACHRCNWTFMYWTEAECKEALLTHIWKVHSGAELAASRTALTPPGR